MPDEPEHAESDGGFAAGLAAEGDTLVATAAGPQIGTVAITGKEFPQLVDNSPPGPRVAKKFVRFGKAYSAPPAVHVSLQGFDIGDNANHRILVDAPQAEITRDGFNLYVHTWWDTRVYAAYVQCLVITR